MCRASAHPAGGLPRAAASGVSSLLVGGAFLAAAIPLAVLPSSSARRRSCSIAALVAAYAAASRVLFEVGAGFAIPTQLVLVPMLFVVPTGPCRCSSSLGLVAGELSRTSVAACRSSA